MIERVLFWVFAVLLVGLSLGVVVSRNVFFSALALAAALSVVAGQYALLGADFLAAAQLLIYVGGVMVLLLFVVMFAQVPRGQWPRQTNRQWGWAALLVLAMGAGLIRSFSHVFHGWGRMAPPEPTTAALGRLLFGPLVFPFEVVSLVLLAALVGAVYFGPSRGKKTPTHPPGDTAP